jgi:hypothetical protein
MSYVVSVNSLSKLAAFLEEDSVPAWVHKQLEDCREDILAALGRGQSYELHGPLGEIITISSKRAAPKPEGKE